MPGAKAALLAAALGSFLAGCTFSQGSLPGGFGQQGVQNEPDHFAYGIQGTKGGTESYDWRNSGAQALVRWGAQGSGTLAVAVKDAAGKQVFQRTFQGGQSGVEERTAAGAPGTWKVELRFSGFAGQGALELARA